MKMIFCYNQKTIKKDKDDWITSLKSEIETASKNFDYLSKSNSSLEVLYKSFVIDNTALKSKCKRFSTNLKLNK